jgi:hypothetical protein
MLNTLRGIIRDGKVELLEHVNLPANRRQATVTRYNSTESLA